MNRLLCFAAAVFFATFCFSGIAAEDAWPKLVPSGDGFEAPQGFKTEVIATEPLVNNPAAMCVAPDGRIFVCEEFVHAHVPGKKRDNVKVLIGKDKDGHPTEALTLAEDLGSVQGMAFADDKLFFSHTPYITMLPVSKENKPGKMEQIVVGVGIVGAAKASHCVSGLRIHDGKLYIVFGDQGCDIKTKEGGRIKLDCGAILRCDLDGSKLEIFAHGFRNIFGVDFDESDNAFVRDNTNDGGGYNVRSYHVVKGAYYGWPFRWREGDSTTPPVDVLTKSHDMGGGSPTGCVYLNAPNMPAQFNGGYLFCEWGIGRMVFSKPDPTGATFDIVEHPFVTAAKGGKSGYSFRPCAAEMAPDGSILIADWASSGLYPTAPKGRIVRVSYDGPKIVAGSAFPIDAMNTKTSPENLMKFLDAQKPLTRAKAAYCLGELKYAPAAEKLAALVTDQNAFVRLRAVTALGDLRDPKLLPVFIKALAVDKDRWVRHLIVRGIRECGDFSSLLNNIESAPAEIQIDLLYATREIYDAKVADGLIYLSKSAKLPELQAKAAEFLGLIAKKEAARWTWGDKPYFEQPVRTVEWEASANILKTLHELIHETQPLVKTAALNALFKLKDTSVVTSIMEDIAAGKAVLDDDTAVILVRSAGNEKAIPLFAKYASDPKAGESARREIVRALTVIKAPEAMGALRAVAFDEKSAPALAAEAINGLGKKKDKASVGKLSQILKTGQPELQRAAAGALGEIGDASTLVDLEKAATSSDRALKTQALIALWRVDNSPHMEKFMALLFALPPSEDSLQSEIGSVVFSGKKAKSEPVTALWLLSNQLGKTSQADALAALVKSSKEKIEGSKSNASIEKFLAKNYAGWKAPVVAKPEANSVPVEDADIRAVRLTEAALAAKGDVTRGAAVFTNKRGANCTGCHAVNGVGAKVGPELTGVGSKYPRPYLIESVLYPSKQLLDGYEMSNLALKSGERLSGIVQAEDKERLTLAKSDGSIATIGLDEISKRQKSKSSLMPDGLVNALNDQDFFDLVAYLESLKKSEK